MFGVDLTWLGWIFVIDMGLSVPVHLYRASLGEYYRRSPGESAIMALAVMLYLMGFFTVGFAH